ncbi:hypothetical protein PMAYCL1PPCAC_13526 [Pristionchus mayeri]|uniref:Uncharacterized protein n=1 Tax=Pristionchus mayeri TaxID=1317129 RepID=A0AAN4ZQQ8_9BILA|nr:hypothetical protein PMAYCL1PPCAC_13526 [Pristionchus mayeri]
MFKFVVLLALLTIVAVSVSASDVAGPVAEGTLRKAEDTIATRNYTTFADKNYTRPTTSPPTTVSPNGSLTLTNVTSPASSPPPVSLNLTSNGLTNVTSPEASSLEKKSSSVVSFVAALAILSAAF